MSKWLTLLLCCVLALSFAQARSRHAKRAKHLDDFIEHVSLTDGMQTIGGASVEDAVNLLRDKVAFPVALEMLEFERPKDFVTLDEALTKLHGMQALAPLAARDKGRLDRYEELAKTRPGSEILVPRQKTFSLIRDRLTVREFLNEITTLDDEYEWKDYGTEHKPLIVVQPRGASALNWSVPPTCKPSPVATERVVAACTEQECSPFTKALGERNMGVLYMAVDEPVIPRKPDPEMAPPHGFIDLCHHNLTAQDVLNRIAISAHSSWTMAGIKGMRFISFYPVGR